MAVGTYRLRVDWNNNGLLTDANEDITSFLVSVDAVRGRDRASNLTGRSVAGRLTALLNNTDGRFSRFNTASPLSGNLLPNRRVQLDMTAPTAGALWTGQLDRIVPGPTVGRIPTVELVAFGPLARFGLDRVNVAMATGLPTGTAVNRILDAVGFSTSTSTHRRIDAGQTTMTRWWVDDEPALKALREVEDSEIGFLYEGSSGHVVFQDRHGRLRSPYLTSQLTLSDAAGATGRYSRVIEQDPLAEVYNRMEAEVRRFATGGSTVLWTLPESSALSPSIGAGQTKTYWARYPNPQSPTNARAVDSWAAMTTADYAANDVAIGGGTDRTANLTVTVTDYATRRRIQVTNNYASGVFLTRLRAQGVPVTVDDPVRIVAEDTATSQAIYGLRRYANPAPWMPDSSFGSDWANFVLGIYKDPIAWLTVEIPANRDNAHLTQAVTREISDRVTLVATTTGTALGINGDYFVERIRHRIRRNGADHTWLMDFSPVDPGYGGGFWVLDTSELDRTTRLAI